MSQKLNGIDVEGLNKMLEEISKEKEKVKELSVWRTRVRWLGGFKSRAYMRRHALDVDEVSDISGIDTAQNAVETLLASLGACITTTFILIATKRNIRVDNLELAIEGYIENILVFLGIEKEGNPGFNNIIVTAYIKSEADGKLLEELFIEAIRASPVFNTLAKGSQIDYKIKTF
ncbi:MAG: OsmC family protein [Thermoproteota archaeon]|jgi:Predicted redox protein, regulator of disulfide bond formation